MPIKNVNINKYYFVRFIRKLKISSISLTYKKNNYNNNKTKI